MDTLTNIRAFLATVEKRSFSGAARQIGVMPSVIMKRVQQLETELQRQLFERSTRRVTLTEAGESSLPELKELLEKFQSIRQRQLSSLNDIQGHLRIKVPTLLGRHWIGLALSKFISENPKLTFDIVLLDRSVNPVEEQFDVAISLWPGTFQGVVEIPLQRYRRQLVASPRYLKRRGAPENPRDLLDHDCLVMGPTGRLWSFERGTKSTSVEVHPKVTLNDQQALLQLACDGHGIAIGAEIATRALIQEKKLAATMPKFHVSDFWVSARVPETRLRSPKIQALVEMLKNPAP